MGLAKRKTGSQESKVMLWSDVRSEHFGFGRDLGNGPIRAGLILNSTSGYLRSRDLKVQWPVVTEEGQYKYQPTRLHQLNSMSHPSRFCLVSVRS